MRYDATPYVESGIGGYDSWGARPDPDRSLWSDRDYSFRFAVLPARLMSAERSMRYDF